MSYVAKLNEWYATEKAAGRVLDLKFFPGMVEPNGSVEKFAKALYETLTGVRPTKRLDTSDL